MENARNDAVLNIEEPVVPKRSYVRRTAPKCVVPKRSYVRRTAPKCPCGK